MYYKIDPFPVLQGKFLMNTKAQRTIINNFPKKIVNGVEVFDRMYVYNGSVTEDKKTDKVLKLLGTSLDELKDEEWKGVKKAWFDFEKFDLSELSITKSSIYQQILQSAQPIEDKGTFEVTFKATSLKAFTLKDIEHLRQLINTGTYKYVVTDILNTTDQDITIEYIHTDGDDDSWYLAYADIDELAYTRKCVIEGTQIRELSQGTEYNTYITLTYRRHDLEDISSIQSPGDPMDVLLERIHTSDVYSKKFLKHILTIDENSIYLKDGDNLYLKVNAVRLMKPKNFAKVIKSSLQFDYKVKKAKWWEKVIAVVLIIIIIIIAVVLCVVSACTSGVAGAALIGIIASYIAVTTLVISLVLTLYAKILTDYGYYGSVEWIGSVVKVSSDISQYAGYVSLLSSVYATGLGNMSTNTILSLVNTGVGIYTKTQKNSDDRQVNKLEDEISAQEEWLSEYFPDKDGIGIYPALSIVDNITNKSWAEQKRYFEDNVYAEPLLGVDIKKFNEVEGLVYSSTTKYFN